MSRQQKSDRHRGKALDLWIPPAGAGEPDVCLATTFTFDGAFFETECLGRFLQMETHPEESDSVGYLVEREEKLATIRAAVLVDRGQARTKESLRWDVIPILVPGGIQHAKLSLLAWTNHVRVIVASGNLTEPGYRKNVEVFGTLDVRADRPGPVAAVRECLGFLDEVLTRAIGDPDREGPLARVRTALGDVRRRIAPWADSDERRPAVVPVFGGLGTPVLDQLRDLWPEASPPTRAEILSPFFDREAAEATRAEILSLLAKRGARAIDFHVQCATLDDAGLRLYAPAAIHKDPPNNVTIRIYPIPEEQDGERRPLHAKSFTFTGNQWALHMLGSSNCTRAGLSIGNKSPNLEANLVYRFRSGSAEHAVLNQVWPRYDDPVDLEAMNLRWEPAFDEESDGTGAVPLPRCFREALFHPGDAARLEIVLDDGLPPIWKIKMEETLLLSSGTAEPGTHAIPWGSLPEPFVVAVTWTTDSGSHAASWPVNVSNPASLPPPDELRGLKLEELLVVLGSTRPLHHSIPMLLARRKRIAHDTNPELDPHKRVNTDAFLLQRTRRVARALTFLKERLERPASRIASLEYRLEGPAGAVALARAFATEARIPEESIFFLAELALTLKRIDVKRIAEGGLEPKKARTKIRECIDAIERLAGNPNIDANVAITRYAREAFEEAKR